MAAYQDSDNPAYQCDHFGGFPSSLIAPYILQIARFENRLEFIKEDRGVTDVVWLDEASAPPAGQVLDGERAFGWFEDEHTLRFRVTDFAPRTRGISRGLDSSSQKLVEGKLVLAEDGMSMSLEYQISDPVHLAEPVVHQGVFFKTRNRALNLSPCDPVSSQMHEGL